MASDAMVVEGLRWDAEPDELGCVHLRDDRGRLCGWVVKARPRWVGHLASRIVAGLGCDEWRFLSTEAQARTWVERQVAEMRRAGQGEGDASSA